MNWYEAKGVSNQTLGEQGHFVMMNRNFFATLLCLAASQILSASVVTNISTGQTDPDPIWAITAGGSGNARVIANPITVANGSVWANPPAGSAWVSTTTANTLPSTTYSLETTFTLNSPGAILQYRALADNRVDVYVDGVFNFNFTGVVAGDFSVLPPTQTVTFATAGLHTIRLDVINNGGFSGVLLSGTVTDTPEPSTFAAMGVGLVLVGLRRRRSAV